MGAIRVIVGFVAIIAVVYGAFQIVPPEMNNYSFQDDLKNIAMTAGANPRQTDDDVKNQIIAKAGQHDIKLADTQVTVERIGTPGAPAVFVAADYSANVNLAVYSFTLHFTPSSGNKGF